MPKVDVPILLQIDPWLRAKRLVMKIGILTHYDVNNMGAQLQLWAMYRHLERLGHEPSVLTYKKNYDFVPELERRNQITLASVPYILKNYLWAKGFGLTWHNVRKYQTLKNFRLRTLRHTPHDTANIDAAIVGADEVFSLELGINKMMFGHGVSTKNMIAYAPSVGQTDMARIDHFDCREIMASGLNEFISLSARDNSTQHIIEELTGRRAEIVCDPALLYDFPLEEYSLPKGTPSGDYVVVYSYDARLNSQDEVEAIKKFAKNHGLKTLSVGTYHKWCDKNIVCNALEWLKCISQAKMVITDTFHGTIAAAITQRPMALTFSREVNSQKMLDLVHRLGLESRLMSEMTLSELERVFSQEQNMEDISLNINNMRHTSQEYLESALKQVVCR